MKIVVQRVTSASVEVHNQVVGQIKRGYVLLVGICLSDTLKEVEYLAKKVASLRIFEDEQGKLNHSIHHVNGQILSISQFTLYGDASEGNRPSFTQAAKGEVALPLFQYFNQVLRLEYGIDVQEGVFGEHMMVHLVNDGPVTILLQRP
ncbi:MAG: D-aminoacyl-tRNA deacylase [bacterium]|nr:D-aminoacyl-tRNA deacylase [bacterium]